jgi:hypothetical protein
VASERVEVQQRSDPSDLLVEQDRHARRQCEQVFVIEIAERYERQEPDPPTGQR